MRIPGAQLWLGTAILLSLAMLLGHTGPGTYSPAALALVALSFVASIAAVCAPAAQFHLPAAGSNKTDWRMLVFLLLVGICLGTATLLWIAPEGIDVYSFQRDGVAALLRGADPYSVTHLNLYTRNPSFYYGPGVVKNGRVQIGCPYPPLSLLAVLPAYLLGDLRFTYIIMVVLSAVLLARMGVSRLTLIAVMLLLLSPVTLFALSRSFTEPLVLLALCWSCRSAQQRSRWLAVALGLLFASKQYAVLAAPFAGLLLPRFTWRAYLRLLATSAAVAAVVTMPFALWNWSNFWRDIVRFQIIQPFRPDALSFSVLGVRLGLPQIPQWLVIIAVLATILWCLRTAARRPAAFPGCFALVLLVFFCLNKQAFVNYYFLVIGASLLAAVMADLPPEPAIGATHNSGKAALGMDVTVS
jgi:hypothetical protein